jgi:hypothetical protein
MVEMVETKASRLKSDPAGASHRNAGLMITTPEVSATESSALDIPVPPRDFGSTRRMLIAAFVASIVTPLLFLGVYGLLGYKKRVSDSSEGIDRLSRVAEEQAGKVLDVTSEMSLSVMAQLGQDRDIEIRERQFPLHNFLGDIVRRLPAVASIAVFGRRGNLLASSSVYPVGFQSLGASPVLLFAQHDAGMNATVSEPEQISDSIANVFDISLPRYDTSGNVLGVLVVSLRREYFQSFYERLTTHDRALTVGLFRSDGTTLVRTPAPSARRAPTRNQPLLDAARFNRESGRLKIISALDGVEKLLVYRRVGDYPLYVTAGIPVSTVTYRWLRHDGFIAIATLLPCIGIWILVLFSLRRLKRERTAWERWKAEFGMRVSAESTSRQMRRMGALGNLVASVAHDFNNLLRSSKRTWS